jgi:antitoxin ParD1/3/4
MATMTVSLPDPMKDWIETQISQGDYASTSDYVRDLVRRDRARREQELTLDELRRKLAASRESGESSRSVDDIFAEAMAIARARGLIHE